MYGIVVGIEAIRWAANIFFAVNDDHKRGNFRRKKEGKKGLNPFGGFNENNHSFQKRYFCRSWNPKKWPTEDLELHRAPST